MKWPRKRFLIPALLIVLLIVAISDFHRWVGRIGDLETPAAPRADGIVALTGGSGKRIVAAISLLEAGAGERLLVSGVHESVVVEDLKIATGGMEESFACCIDIGRDATSTQGNAIETRSWVKTHGFTTVILVTSDYHMPRARLWFAKEASDIILVAYPMQSLISAKKWWSSWTSFRGLVTEWAKYRVTAVILAF